MPNLMSCSLGASRVRRRPPGCSFILVNPSCQGSTKSVSGQSHSMVREHRACTSRGMHSCRTYRSHQPAR